MNKLDVIKKSVKPVPVVSERARAYERYRFHVAREEFRKKSRRSFMKRCGQVAALIGLASLTPWHGRKQEVEDEINEEELEKDTEVSEELETYEYNEDKFCFVATELKNFYDCFQGGANIDCELFMRYKGARGSIEQLDTNILRRVLLEFVNQKVDLEEYEKYMLEQNVWIFPHVLNLLQISFTGKNVAGGKKQLSGKEILFRKYEGFRKDSRYEKLYQSVVSSQQLGEIVDPLVVLSLIANETDFANMYNVREGVSGPFQFTEQLPPEGDYFPESTKRVREQLYNDFYGRLSDIEDPYSRKNIAMCLAFIFEAKKTLDDKFSAEDAVDENIRDNFSMLMSYAFYNSSLGKRINREDFPEDVRNNASSFINTLNYRGSRAGKLYVPALISHYLLLKQFDRTGNANIDEERIYLELFEMCFKPNFGLSQVSSKEAEIVLAEHRVPIRTVPIESEPEKAQEVSVATAKIDEPTTTSRRDLFEGFRKRYEEFKAKVLERKPAENPKPPESVKKKGNCYIDVIEDMTKYSLHNTYFKSLDHLYEYNRHIENKVLQIGVRVYLPEKYIFHDVQKGETTYGISKRYKISLDELKVLNSMVDKDNWSKETPSLNVGEKVIVPRSS